MRYESFLGRGLARWEKRYTHGQQLALRDTSTPEILLTGAYRSGKTEPGCRQAIIHSLCFTNARFGVFRAYRQSLKATTLITLLELTPPDEVKSWSNTEFVLEFHNGSRIELYGADEAQKIGGLNLSGAFVDEATELSEESLGMIRGRLSGELHPDPDAPESFQWYRDGIAASQTRQLVLACNPRSKSHLLYKQFYEEPTPSRRAITSNIFENPHIPVTFVTSLVASYLREHKPLEWVRAEIEKIRSLPQGSPGSAGESFESLLNPFGQRNVLGHWVALEGAVYDLDREQHTLTQFTPSGGHYIASVDFGFNHPRVVVFHVAEDPTKPCGFCFTTVAYWSGKEKGDSVQAAIERLNEVYHFAHVVLPPDQPAIKRDIRLSLGSTVVLEAKTAVLDGILRTYGLISTGALRFLQAPGFEVFWGELERYEWKRSTDGAVLDAPVKVADHYPDALRYGVVTYLHRYQSLSGGKEETPKTKNPNAIAGVLEELGIEY